MQLGDLKKFSQRIEKLLMFSLDKHNVFGFLDNI